MFSQREASVEAGELIKFGILAAIVIIIAIVARQGQTVHHAPGAIEDVAKNDSVQEPKGLKRRA